MPKCNNKIKLSSTKIMAEATEAAAKSLSSMRFSLNTGRQMPAVGLGTFRIRKEEDIMRTMDYALQAGYRLFDTAAVYGNEVYLKKAFQKLLPKYSLEREDIFVTTKLSPSDHGPRHVCEKAYKKSLDNLGLDYVDLYLIHFPGSSRIRSDDERNIKLRRETWAGLQELYHEGRVNAIGVSNFTVKHLEDLLSTNPSVIPAVNQVEWHPYYYEKDLLDFCKRKDIVLQAYSSFGGTSSDQHGLLEEPIVKRIADKVSATCAQVLLVWALQQDVAVIPKSTNPNRIKENISVDFTLSDEDLKAINALGEKNTKYAWDPHNVA